MSKKTTTSSITTTPELLQVNGDSGLIAIGIAAPKDSQYPASRLTVTVTGLPTDGTVYLSDGVTPVYHGETLSAAQLTGLMFKPTVGLFGTTSTLTYTVTDPSGARASGLATLAIGADTMPPVTTSASLTVAENAAPTAIGVAAPTDPNYSASQLSIKVIGLPADGTVLLSDGVTQVTSGETLTVAQLTGLMFKPTPGTCGHGPTFAHSFT